MVTQFLSISQYYVIFFLDNDFSPWHFTCPTASWIVVTVIAGVLFRPSVKIRGYFALFWIDVKLDRLSRHNEFSQIVEAVGAIFLGMSDRVVAAATRCEN